MQVKVQQQRLLVALNLADSQKKSVECTFFFFTNQETRKKESFVFQCCLILVAHFCLFYCSLHDLREREHLNLFTSSWPQLAEEAVQSHAGVSRSGMTALVRVPAVDVELSVSLQAPSQQPASYQCSEGTGYVETMLRPVAD